MLLQFSQPVGSEAAVRTREDCVAVLGGEVLLHNLLARMGVIAAGTFVPDLQMNRILVNTSRRAGFEDRIAVRTRIAFQRNLAMFSIHVSLHVATGCTAVSAEVTLEPTFLVVNLIVRSQAVLIMSFEITLVAQEDPSFVLGFCVVFQLSRDICSVVTHVAHQLLMWSLQSMRLVFVGQKCDLCVI